MSGPELAVVGAALIVGAVAPKVVRRIVIIVDVVVAGAFAVLRPVVVAVVYGLLRLLRIVPALELPPASARLRSLDAEVRQWLALAGIDIDTDPKAQALLATLIDLDEDGVRCPPFFE